MLSYLVEPYEKLAVCVGKKILMEDLKKVILQVEHMAKPGLIPAYGPLSQE